MLRCGVVWGFRRNGGLPHGVVPEGHGEEADGRADEWSRRDRSKIAQRFYRWGYDERSIGVVGVLKGRVIERSAFARPFRTPKRRCNHSQR